ncbi:MAG: mechanosensitive ion channel, partial [Alphaproteobacteria bacterium]
EAQNAIASISVAGIIISMLRIKASNGDVGSEVHRIGPQYLRIPLWLIALTILASAAAGYIPLARFITAQLIITSTVIIIVYLLSYWANSFGQSLADDESMVGLWLRDQVGLTQERREKLVLPITLLLKVLVILSAVPFIMFLWGFDAHDIRRWVELALFGFDLGNFKISLTGILGALAVFVGAYVAAGIFRVWLDRNVLEPAHVEGSVRDSVRAAVGYLGFILAAIAAVSYAGFDFSNLAIVAGALSVGLGFGMQSIVNNFVSGLILLAERPIKVGDWIVVGEEEGIVRNIHVRATEIETFERANIIIPNSQLISETVKNRTLYNNTRRVRIPVGVHYDSDPDQVRDILLAVANEHSQVLSVPEPFVFFDDFGDNSLNFALYVYLANARQSFSIQTDLRFAIL